jgi:hypothetical protein
VSIVCRLGLVLIGVRLLVPPCVCLCQLTAPAARFVAGLLGGDLPPPEPEDPDHHHDGCPASKLSVGLGVPPASCQPCIAPCVAVLDRHPTRPSEIDPLFATFSLAADPPRPPLCLTLCALLI